MTPTEGESSPPAGLRDRNVFLAGDEAERIGRERDPTRQATEIFVGLAPDGCTEGSDGFLSRSGRRSTRNSADPPLRTPSDDGCRQTRGRLPVAARRSDSGPRGREPSIGQSQCTLVVGRCERGDDEIALELRVSLHDAHREHCRGLIEEPVGRQSGSREREYTPRRLQPNPFIGDAGGSPEEGQNVLRGLGVCKKKLVGHTL